MGYAPIIRNSYTDDIVRTKKFDEICLLYSINLYKDFKKGSKPLFKVIGTDKNMFFNKKYKAQEDVLDPFKEAPLRRLSCLIILSGTQTCQS